MTSLRPAYFDLSYENDLFFSTDYYYSQGTHLSFSAPVLSRSPLLYFFPDWVKKGEEQHSFLLAHDFYTPIDISVDSASVGDRPYACSFYIKQVLSDYETDRNHAFHTSLSLGIFGPWALGEQSQKAIHRWTDSQEPKGWDNQIRNDFLLNYQLRFEAAAVNAPYFQMGPSLQLDVGTVLNQIAASAWCRLGWMENPMRPFQNKRFQFYTEGEWQSRGMLYNAYLQGGLINRNSPYVLNFNEVSHFVHRARIGAYLAVYNIRLGYTLHFLSPEIDGGRVHRWGQCELRWTF